MEMVLEKQEKIAIWQESIEVLHMAKVISKVNNNIWLLLAFMTLSYF